MELWLHAFAVPGRVADLAQEAEAWGFDGLLVADSQSLNADVWVELALAGAATTRLRLGPGVTNPRTRHLAVTASAAATLQAETGGRAVLGFARGDSALSQVGLTPPSVTEFARDLAALQSLLRGETTDVGGAACALRWLDPKAPKAPVHVAASGPQVIAAGARRCEGVDLTVGAELARIRWGVEAARSAADAAGVASPTIGAYLNVAVDEDREAARALVRGSTSIFGRFAAEAGKAGKAGLSDVTERGVEQLASGYERGRHGAADSDYARQLDDAFVDRFAVVGAPAEVRDRLAEIAAAGVDRLIVVPGSVDTEPGPLHASIERFARDVRPALTG